MKPIKAIDWAADETVIFAKDQPEYLPLPAHRKPHDLCGWIETCWKPTIFERIALIFGAPLRVEVLTFSNPLQPMLITVRRNGVKRRSDNEVTE